MRAGVLRDCQLAVVDVADPRPEPGQLLVRTLACGICGTDLHFARHAKPSCRLTTSSGRPWVLPLSVTRTLTYLKTSSWDTNSAPECLRPDPLPMARRRAPRSYPSQRCCRVTACTA